MLDSEEYHIQMQHEVVMVSQGNGIILKGEKYGGIYKLKEENSIQNKVLMTSLKGSSSRGGASRKTATGYELDQSVTKKEKWCI